MRAEKYWQSWRPKFGAANTAEIVIVIILQEGAAYDQGRVALAALPREARGR
jgi:hypothetical protein